MRRRISTLPIATVNIHIISIQHQNHVTSTAQESITQPQKMTPNPAYAVQDINGTQT